MGVDVDGGLIVCMGSQLDKVSRGGGRSKGRLFYSGNDGEGDIDKKGVLE